MLGTIFDIAIGITIGWFFLPRPSWAVNAMIALAVRFPILTRFIKK